jgi:starch-binding outer membrane protein, SusD/RagB family
MKKLKYIVLAVAVLILAQSCADFLDKDPLVNTQLTHEEIFSDTRFAPGFLNNIYNNLPDGYSRFGGAMLAAASDEAMCSDAGAAINLLNKNAINSTNNPDDVWANMYAGIRKCNIFLYEIEDDGIIAQTNSIPVEKDGLKVRDFYKGQALFLRAFFHFELLKRYQNIFYVTKVLDPFNEDELFSEEQISFDQAVEKIVADFDAASALLPVAYYKAGTTDQRDDSYNGRPTKWTPLALKSRVLLYAASPLNNPSNDKDKWLRAANAAKEIIDSKVFGLSSLSGIFNTPYNKEIIFAASASNRNDIERYNLPVSFEGSGYMNPTEDLVKEFGMAAKTHVAKYDDYDANDPYSLVNTRKREERFRSTFFANGSRLNGVNVATYVGGKDGLFATPTATKTGYYMSKFVDQSLDLSKGNTSQRPWVFMRYAEILLNYAEALNEYDNVANFTAISNSLDLIRDRASLRKFSTADKTLLRDQTEMRKYIKMERRIELAFEEHRYWDLRRWKDAEEVLNKPVTGMRIVQDENGNFTYTTFEADQRVFDPKMYWYPIPRTEILKYKHAGKTIVQNPGWE